MRLSIVAMARFSINIARFWISRIADEQVGIQGHGRVFDPSQEDVQALVSFAALAQLLRNVPPSCGGMSFLHSYSPLSA